MSLKNKVEKNILPAFKENNIPIVFSSDNNYCPYLAVAIKSLSDYITKTLKIPDQSKYFNSGVLLIDILKITKFNLLKKSLDKLMEIKEPIFVDQCILNSVCYGNVKLLDSKYNHYAAYIKNTNKIK